MSETKTVGKGDLIETLAKEAGLSKAAATKVLAVLLDEIQQRVKRGHRVTITGFGTFSARKRAARTGRNPKTGATLKIKAATVPGFKAGAGFKAIVGKK